MPTSLNETLSVRPDDECVVSLFLPEATLLFWLSSLSLSLRRRRIMALAFRRNTLYQLWATTKYHHFISFHHLPTPLVAQNHQSRRRKSKSRSRKEEEKEKNKNDCTHTHTHFGCPFSTGEAAAAAVHFLTSIHIWPARTTTTTTSTKRRKKQEKQNPIFVQQQQSDSSQQQLRLFILLSFSALFSSTLLLFICALAKSALRCSKMTTFYLFVLIFFFFIALPLSISSQPSIEYDCDQPSTRDPISQSKSLPVFTEHRWWRRRRRWRWGKRKESAISSTNFVAV